MIEDWEAEKAKREERQWPTWLYLVLFVIPATGTFCLMAFALSQDLLFSAITALAVMNGSINSVIAYLTIQLDTKSSESLQHLENINSEMDRLEATLEEANDKVQRFTSDLDEAKELFKKVGVDLHDLDLEPVADVVERLKENKDGLNQVLDHLRNIDVEEYIDQAKRIDWKSLLSAAEEVMGFIEKRNQPSESPMKSFKPVLDTPVPEDEDVDVEPDWARYRDSQYMEDNDDWDEEEEEDEEDEEDEPPAPTPRLSLSREPPKKKTPTLERKPKKNLSLKR